MTVGPSLADFLREWCERGSQGLKAEWLTNVNPARSPPQPKHAAAAGAVMQGVGSLLSVARDIVKNSRPVVDAESTQMLASLQSIFPSTLAAVSFLVFVLLYMPCVAAFAAMRREMESGHWATGAVAAQTCLAWLLATLVFQVGRLLGLG